MKENSTAKVDKPMETKAEKPAVMPAKKEAAEAKKADAAAQDSKAAPAKAEKKAPSKKKAEEPKKDEKKRDLVLERVYTLPLRKAFNAPKQWRQNTATRLLRDFIIKHTKTEAKGVKISPLVNEFVRAKGKASVPKTIKVKIAKDKEGITTVDLA